MLYNLINLPNLMGARRSCGQFFQIHSTQETKKLLPTSYVRGPVFNGSSTKCCVLLSRNSFAQRHCYYKVYVRWALQNLFLMDLTHDNASAPSYTSHRLSPTFPRKTRSRKKPQRWETSKSRPYWRRTPHLTFQCGTRMGPKRLFSCTWRRYWTPSRSVVTLPTTTRPRRLINKPRRRLSWQRLV